MPGYVKDPSIAQLMEVGASGQIGHAPNLSQFGNGSVTTLLPRRVGRLAKETRLSNTHLKTKLTWKSVQILKTEKTKILKEMMRICPKDLVKNSWNQEDSEKINMKLQANKRTFQWQLSITENCL